MRDFSTKQFGYLLVKRLVDVVVSFSLLILLAPFLLLIALAVKVSSTGPIIFRQQRVGLNGRTFWIYKFRTMENLSRQESDTRWTTAQDGHVTRIGGYLRHIGLDELPQLMNVLTGDMSIVGPRPERPYFVEIFKREIPGYITRHAVKCGMTGWAQVNGWRGNTSIHKRTEHDLYYLEHRTLWFDLRILFLTLHHVISQPEPSASTFAKSTHRPSGQGTSLS